MLRLLHRAPRRLDGLLRTPHGAARWSTVGTGDPPTTHHPAQLPTRRHLTTRAPAADLNPMTISDRVEADAVARGSLSGLSGEGKPLSEADENSQVHVAKVHKNMEARAEAEMQRYGRTIGFTGDGKPLPEESHPRGPAQAAIQAHAQKSALGK